MRLGSIASFIMIGIVIVVMVVIGSMMSFLLQEMAFFDIAHDHNTRTVPADQRIARNVGNR